MAPIPPEFKGCKPFIQRAEELDKATTDEAKVVAYYCRKHAMEVGMGLRDRAADQQAATDFLLDLMEGLETAKKELGDLSEDEGEQVVFKFASDIFSKADAEDRRGAATKHTARTFYAASIFFECLKQFEDGPGEEAEEKCRYAKWKAADIVKAIKDGRQPAPGGRRVAAVAAAFVATEARRVSEAWGKEQTEKVLDTFHSNASRPVLPGVAMVRRCRYPTRQRAPRRCSTRG